MTTKLADGGAPRRGGRAARRRPARLPVTRIGHFLSGPAEVTVRGADSAPMPLATRGWSHF